MKKTRLLVLPFVLLLAAAVGCDENNNMMNQPGEGDPPPSSKCEGVDLDDCPCDYDTIPKDAQCWLLEGPDLSSVIYVATDSSCKLAVSVNDTDRTPFMEADTAGLCSIELEMLDAPTCLDTNIFVTHQDLTPDETTACQCALEQYTKELIQVPIPVMDDTASALTAEGISCPAE